MLVLVLMRNFEFQYIKTSEALCQVLDYYDLARPLIHCMHYWAKVCSDCISMFIMNLSFYGH